MRNKISLFLSFFAIYCFVQTYAFNKTSCSLDSDCEISAHRRCYNFYNDDTDEIEKQCQCLKGLYEYNGECIGATRYLFNFKIYEDPFFIDEPSYALEINRIFDDILNEYFYLNDYEMELEVYDFAESENRNAIIVSSSLTVWKKFAKDPHDLPTIKYSDIYKLFKKHLKYDAVNDVTFLKSFPLSSSTGNRTDNILNSIEFKVYSFACSNNQFNYCGEHATCDVDDLYGSVKCKCNSAITIDVSPELKLFPAERCSVENNEKDCNKGHCLYEYSEEKCFCYGRHIGYSCYFDIFLFIALSGFVIVLLAGFFVVLSYFLYKKKKEQDLKNSDETIAEKVKESSKELDNNVFEEDIISNDDEFFDDSSEFSFSFFEQASSTYL